MADSDKKEGFVKSEEATVKKVTSPKSSKTEINRQPGFFDDEEALQILKPKEEGGYELNEEALIKIFHHPDVKENPVMIVSVTGAMRSGKSFLLTLMLRYLNSEIGTAFCSPSRILQHFKWKQGCMRETVGVYMWSKPYFIHKTDGSMVATLLMDTQGAFDESEYRASLDIFAFSTWLSSLQICNVQGDIGEDYLRFVNNFVKYSSDLRSLLKTDDFDRKQSPFQGFCFLRRDWTDEETYSYGFQGGHKYLAAQQAKIISNRSNNIDDRSEIESVFEEVQCYLLPSPGDIVIGGFYPNVENKLHYSSLKEDFILHLDEFCFQIFQPDFLTTKKVGGLELKGEDVLKYLHQCHELLESRKISVPLTIIEHLFYRHKHRP
ncbi:atlastin-1-like [Clavelina lepadiformis]|uniref:atlastin-1-like n=1 Tax=Clavelina lepadiformis TaxID=159417 RepID=UPI0040416A3A